MSFVSDAIEMALTRLTKQLLEHDAHKATSLVCAQGEFYRAEIRLERIDPADIARHLPDVPALVNDAPHEQG
ncbi:hypothetical protein CWI66_16845 [Halomonas sp. 141]|uniref:Uncharacterized protein n=1 Tax=Vreelandella hamiltonii TaxID=502829 RepID=A0A8H9I643_9GAMM|nr:MULTISPECIES: hypothetical protein [Halomonas]ATH77150.1 hypothetical protein CLM76_05875 [Halomonas hydrothermalis]PJX12603.1 hypothetical protein CWI66_16845 [Halomonas sp. 141]GGW41598.1 hypothetical protein GCM10007157_35030 [Halomonas hamiltonii]